MNGDNNTTIYQMNELHAQNNDNISTAADANKKVIW